MNEVPPATPAAPPPAPSSGGKKWVLAAGAGCLIMLLALGGAGVFAWRYLRKTNTFIEFTNSRDRVPANYVERYTDFSFRYPKNWLRVPEGEFPRGGNYVVVEHREGDYTVEQVGVGTYHNPNPASDFKSASKLLADMVANPVKKYANMVKIGEGPFRFGKYDAYEMHSESHPAETGQPVKTYWIRMVLIKNPKGGNNGVIVTLIASNLSPDIKSSIDVGVDGEIPAIIDSFEFK